MPTLDDGRLDVRSGGQGSGVDQNAPVGDAGPETTSLYQVKVWLKPRKGAAELRDIVEFLWLNRARAQARRMGFQRQRYATGQPATAATDQHISGLDAFLGGLFGDFQPAGALPRDHLWLVIGFDQRQAAL